MDNVVINNQTLQPEENDLWEAGLKYEHAEWQARPHRRLVPGDQEELDPDRSNQWARLLQTNETQRVQGVELGLTGKITDQWDIQAAYAYMDSEILSARQPPTGMSLEIASHSCRITRRHSGRPTTSRRCCSCPARCCWAAGSSTPVSTSPIRSRRPRVPRSGVGQSSGLL